MPEPTGEIGYLKKQIVDLISQDIDTVQDVVDYEKVGFKGYPAVTVVCSGNENSFYSSAENLRTFMFTLRIYYPITNKPALDTSGLDNAKQKAEAIVERVVDQFLNSIDTTTKFTLDDAADNGVEAVPSRWGYAQLPVGWCRVAEIEVRLKRIKLVV